MTFDYRKNDRGFQAGDTLNLREYVNCSDTFTGREQPVKVVYFLGSCPGLPEGYCIMGIEKLPPLETIEREDLEALHRLRQTQRPWREIVEVR
jgi:hypothetical protein